MQLYLWLNYNKPGPHVATDPISFEYKVPYKSLRTLIVMFFWPLGHCIKQASKVMHVLKGLWRGSNGTEQCLSHCMRNFDSLPGGIVGLLLSAVPTVQTVWRSFHRDWITEDFCSVFFGIIESTEGAWFLCLMIWRWRQEPAGLCQSYGHAQHRLQKI